MSAGPRVLVKRVLQYTLGWSADLCICTARTLVQYCTSVFFSTVHCIEDAKTTRVDSLQSNRFGLGLMDIVCMRRGEL